LWPNGGPSQQLLRTCILNSLHRHCVLKNCRFFPPFVIVRLSFVPPGCAIVRTQASALRHRPTALFNRKLNTRGGAAWWRRQELSYEPCARWHLSSCGLAIIHSRLLTIASFMSMSHEPQFTTCCNTPADMLAVSQLLARWAEVYTWKAPFIATISWAECRQ